MALTVIVEAKRIDGTKELPHATTFLYCIRVCSLSINYREFLVLRRVALMLSKGSGVRLKLL